MPNILAFGGGVDSTTLLAINLDRDRTAAYLGITRETLDERFPAEAAFEATSPVKHQAWLDAGKPLSQGKRPRAPNGMWKKDSWADGQRLFVKTVNGKRLSVTEWEAYFTSKEEKAA